MQFIYPALAWGFLLVIAPLAIHLINLMRRRRVQWAAMDFLLKSHKKHRTWVWLKQMLLLLSRMAVIALLVAMLAKLVAQSQWASFFGGKATHHYILVDDSYSMSERGGAASAFDAARMVLSRISSQAAAQDTQQKITLLRFSKASGGSQLQVGDVADLNAENIGSDFSLKMEEVQRAFAATQLAVGPREGLEAFKELLSQGGDEENVVYLLSDFRKKEWGNPSELRGALIDLEKLDAEIHLVRCVRKEQPNLAITEIAPADETRAAGVPLFVHVKVKNFGAVAAKNVSLKIRSAFYPPSPSGGGRPAQAPRQIEELPTVLIDEIAPGTSATERVQVYFPQPGRHAVEAILPEDPIAADNRRWCVIDFPEGEAVLVIDGSAEQQNAYFLKSVFQPGGRANTGIIPEVQPVAFLRDTPLDQLVRYSTIYLLDVDRIDASGVKSLEKFVRGGGSLAIFAGPHTNASFYNEQLYRDGEGVMPLPLGFDDLLAPSLLDNAPDIKIDDHPVFRIFMGEQNPLINLITVERYLAPKEGWTPAPDSTVEIAAWLRNQSPLAVEKKFGDGRVFVVLTSLAPEWNNWGHDPSFVVVLLKLQSYLSSSQRTTTDRLVGTPIDLELQADKYRPEVSFVLPDVKEEQQIVVQRTAQQIEGSPLMRTSLGQASRDGNRGDETRLSGVYEAWATFNEGNLDIRRYALNVDPDEGDLSLVPSQTLLDSLAPLKPKLHSFDEYDELAWNDLAGFNRSALLMTLLLGLLLGEQLLAYNSSYHSAKGGTR